MPKHKLKQLSSWWMKNFRLVLLRVGARWSLEPLSFQGTGYTGIARELPAARKEGWLVLGLRPTGAWRAEWLKRGMEAEPQVGMSSARADGIEPRPKRRCMRS